MHAFRNQFGFDARKAHKHASSAGVGLMTRHPIAAGGVYAHACRFGGGEQLANTMTDQVAAGTLAGDKLAQCQKLHRNAQFYWDFVMVENGDGAHNSKLSDETLDKSEKAVDEALALLA